MYNLGLGNLEFSVNHTIEVHRPEGVRIPGNLWDDANNSQITSEWHSIVFKKLHDNTHQHDGILLHPRSKSLIENLDLIQETLCGNARFFKTQNEEIINSLIRKL